MVFMLPGYYNQSYATSLHKSSMTTMTRFSGGQVLDITPERLDKIPLSGLVNIDPPVKAELPLFIQDYLKKMLFR